MVARATPPPRARTATPAARTPKNGRPSRCFLCVFSSISRLLSVVVVRERGERARGRLRIAYAVPGSRVRRSAYDSRYPGLGAIRREEQATEFRVLGPL